MSNILKYLIRKFKTPTSDSFIRKFLTDSDSKNCQMELLYKDKGLLIVQSLKHVPSWIERANIKENKYDDGFVLLIWFPKKNIEKNKDYQRYINTKDSLTAKEYDNNSVLTYLHFFEKSIDSIDLGNYIKNLIDNVYDLPQTNPQILFNVRYL